MRHLFLPFRFSAIWAQIREMADAEEICNGKIHVKARFTWAKGCREIDSDVAETVLALATWEYRQHICWRWPKL